MRWLVVLLVFSCLLPAAHGQIVGGRDARIEDWPGFASMQSVNGNSVDHQCGATMIAPGWALTAAHCLDGVELDAQGHAQLYAEPEDGGGRFRVGAVGLAAGRADLRDTRSGAVFRVTGFVVHPGYEPGAPEGGDDIALLRISGAWTGPLMPLAGFAGGGTSLDGPFPFVTAAGFGKTSEGAPNVEGRSHSGRLIRAPNLTLQEAAVPVVEGAACQAQVRAVIGELGLSAAYGDVQIDPARQICAGGARRRFLPRRQRRAAGGRRRGRTAGAGGRGQLGPRLRARRRAGHLHARVGLCRLDRGGNRPQSRGDRALERHVGIVLAGCRPRARPA
jgi:hypothetical protein